MAIVNPRLLIKNLADYAAISASPSLIPSLLETYLQMPARNKTARTTSLASQDIKLSWAADQRVNMVALRYHNLTTSAQLRVRTYTDSAWTTGLIDNAAANCFAYTGLSDKVDLLDPDFRIFKNSPRYFTLATNVRSMIITVIDPTNPDGYMDFSRLFVGEYWEFAYGAPYNNAPVSFGDMSVQGRSDSGNIVTDKRGRYVIAGINPEFITMAADYKELAAAAMSLGLSKDFWFSTYPKEGTILEMYNQNAYKFTSIPTMDRDMPGSMKSQIKMEST